MRPEAFALLKKLMQRFEAATGLKSTIPAYGGVRTPADQQQLLQWRADTASTYAVGGGDTSRPVYGGAFDLHILRHVAGAWEKGGAWSAGRIAPEYLRLGEIGEGMGLVWGGRWTGKESDPYHFQLNETLSQARARWASHRGRLLPADTGNQGMIVGAVAGGLLLLVMLARR